MGGQGDEFKIVTEATSMEHSHHGVPLHYISEIKVLGRKSHDGIRALFDAIMSRLNEPHCGVRLCALELWEVLFERSSLFRKLGSCKLSLFFDRVVGKRRAGRLELPGPSPAAEELRRHALELIQQWNATYGHVLPRLRLGYRYLKTVQGVVFPQRTETAGVRDDALLPEHVEETIEAFVSREEEWNILVGELNTAQVVFADIGLRDVRETVEPEMDDDNVWEDVDAEPDVAQPGEHEVRVPLLDRYREASSKIIPRLQRMILTCRDHADRARVREFMEKAVALNAALVGACALYEKRIGDTMNQSASVLHTRNNNSQHDTPSTSARTQVPPSEVVGRNPMLQIRDPAAPRANVPSKAVGTTSSRSTRKSNECVLAKLASIAPVVPASGFANVWDSDAPPVYAGAHSMEVSNHWGPVDVHQELPKDRLDSLFLIDQSKVRYKEDGQLAPARRNPSSFDREEGLACMTHVSALSSLQRDVLDAPSRVDSKKAEKLYNDSLLREANSVPGEHLTALDDLPCQAKEISSSQPIRNHSAKRKKPMPVHERLAKKLFIKRK